MENENKFMKIFKSFLPLIFSIIAIAFLFGTILTYKIKYVPDGAEEAIKESFNFNLINAFDASLTPSWPIISILVLIVLGGVIPLFTLLKNDKIKEYVAVIATFAFLFAICLLVAYKELFVYFGQDLITHFYSADIGYGVALAILFSVFGAFASLLTSDKQYGDNVQGIVEDAVLVALAFVLNFVKLPISTGAGSINFQMLPLFLIALRRGPLHGFVAGGIVYGFLTCMTDGYGFQTYPFDYLIGFGSVAVLGFFSKYIMDENNNFALREVVLFSACLGSTFIRFIGSSVSSMVFYGLSFGDALIYNIIYIPVSGLIASIVIMLTLYPITIINNRFPVKQ